MYHILHKGVSMFFKYLFLALSLGSLAMAKDKAADLVKKEKKEARHNLYQQFKTKSICSLDSEKRSYYRTILLEHLEELQARQARIAALKKDRMASGVALLGGALGSCCVVALIMHKMHSGAYNKKEVIEVVKAATEIAQETTNTEKVEEVVDQLPGAAFCAFFTGVSACMFAQEGVARIKKALRYEEYVQEKIDRDQRVLAWLLMQ